MEFIYAGIDFIVDKNNDIFFIEINSSPGGLYRIKHLYDISKPLDSLIEVIKKRVKNPVVCIVDSRKNYEIDKDEFDGRIKEMNKEFESHFCFFEDQVNKNFFVDKNGETVRPNVVITPFLSLKQSIKNAWIINPFEISFISIDKFLSTKLVEKCTNINVPKTFLVRSKRDVRILLKQEPILKNGFVIKPRFGLFGRKVMVFDKVSELEKVKLPRGEYVLQERISVNKINGNFWDIRALVVDGKYCGGYKRVSSKPVVNIHAGGRREKLENWVEEKIKEPSEEIVKVIEKYAKLI